MRPNIAFPPDSRAVADPSAGPCSQDGSDSPPGRQRRPGRAALAVTVAALGGLVLAGCGPDRPPGTVGFVEGFAGAVVADEPRAVVIARDILSSGGTAADAAVAMALTLTVTLPSSAGLGGGGVCLLLDRDADDEPRLAVLDFLPDDRAGLPGPDGAAAVPALPRGLFALHARAGALRWETLVAPAENLARFGFPASRALAAEVQALGGAPPDMWLGTGPMVYEGQRLQALDLARALGQVRVGPGEFHVGSVAREIIDAAAVQGAEVSQEILRDWRPTWVEPVISDSGSHLDAAAPVPDSAARFARDWATAEADADDDGLSLAPLPDLAESLRTRGATGFAVADSYGGAVACGLTLNHPFGTGRPLNGLGFPLAPMPDARSPDIALLMRYNDVTGVFLGALAAAGGGAGQAALEAGVPAFKDDVGTGAAVQSVSAGGLGRALVNLIRCAGGLPRDPESCSVAVDPRGAGLGMRVGQQ
nr:gamma-glutamyltransferase [Roseospira navarrensis]